MVVSVGGDGSRNMGQGTQQRMTTFWETVANAPGIKGADNVMFELMNEPVAIETNFGANDWGFGSARFWQAWQKPWTKSSALSPAARYHCRWQHTREWSSRKPNANGASHSPAGVSTRTRRSRGGSRSAIAR